MHELQDSPEDAVQSFSARTSNVEFTELTQKVLSNAVTCSML